MSTASSGGPCRATLTLLRALALYWFVIYPRTREELRRWYERANAIHDSTLREHALGKLRDGRMVLEGAAAFAILAAPRHRIDVMRACVAFEVIYEFTDVLGEQPVDDPLAHNTVLNRALLAAVQPMTPHQAYVRGLSSEDPDYLHELIDVCRDGIMRLPQHHVILSTVQRLAAVAADAQTLNHAGAVDGHCQLARWAAAQGPADATWWELAAAASSPLGIFALFAAASMPTTTDQTVAGIENAYFPWIGAVVWLLESLVDHLEDADTDNLNYFGQYASTEEAARRLVAVSQRATDAAGSLPNGALHVLLLAGGVGLYLSTHEARHPEVRDVSDAICEAIGGEIRPLMRMLRMRRMAGRLRRLG